METQTEQVRSVKRVAHLMRALVFLGGGIFLGILVYGAISHRWYLPGSLVLFALILILALLVTIEAAERARIREIQKGE